VPHGTHTYSPERLHTHCGVISFVSHPQSLVTQNLRFLAYAQLNMLPEVPADATDSDNLGGLEQLEKSDIHRDGYRVNELQRDSEAIG